jgi:hypothetical protein
MMSGKAKWTLATRFARSNGLRKVGQFANGHRLQDGMPQDPLPTLSDDLLAGWGYNALKRCTDESQVPSIVMTASRCRECWTGNSHPA